MLARGSSICHALLCRGESLFSRPNMCVVHGLQRNAMSVKVWKVGCGGRRKAEIGRVCKVCYVNVCREGRRDKWHARVVGG